MPFLETYGFVEVGEPLGLIGSHGFFEVSVNQGSASDVMNIKNGDRFELRF